MLTSTKGYLCKTCMHRGTTQNGSPACTIHKKLINLDKDFCSEHLHEAQTIKCRICGNNYKQSDILVYQFDNSNVYLCPSCSQHISTCATCINQSNCGFKADRSEPQMVSRTVRQGMMMMQTQVKNPNLIKKHCLNCLCSYGTEGDCLKDEKGANCAKWQVIPELLYS